MNEIYFYWRIIYFSARFSIFFNPKIWHVRINPEKPCQKPRRFKLLHLLTHSQNFGSFWSLHILHELQIFDSNGILSLQPLFLHYSTSFCSNFMHFYDSLSNHANLGFPQNSISFLPLNLVFLVYLVHEMSLS